MLVPYSFRHGHPPITCQSSWDCTQHQYQDHDDRCQSIHFAPFNSIPKPTKHQLTYHRAQKSYAQQSWQNSWLDLVLSGLWLILEVNPSDELHNRRDTEEIVCIREEAHACYDDCLEMVKLCSCRVERWKNFQWRHLVRYSKSANTEFLKKSSTSFLKNGFFLFWERESRCLFICWQFRAIYRV